jgi:hypothetical protein
LTERSEFELPVPVSELSYDSTMLGFAIETDCETLLPRTAFLMRWFLSLEAAEPKWGCLSLELSCRISRGVAHAHEQKASLERCDSSAEPALEFRTIRATRLSVANYNTNVVV